MGKSIGRNAAYNFIKTLSGMIFPVITFSYASRVLGVDGIGNVSFSKTIVTYFIVLALLGIKFYGTREVAKLRTDKQKLSKFVHEMLIINGFTTMLSYILLGIVILSVPKLKNYRDLLMLNSISIIMSTIGMEWLYQGLEEYQYISIRTILFQFIAFILMLFLVHDETNVMEYAFVSLISSSGTYLLNFIFANKFVTFKYCGKYDIKKHLKPIFWLFAMAVSIELYTMLDTTMLGFLCDDAVVGRYTAAIRTSKIVSSLIVSLVAVLSPRLAYYLEFGKKNDLHELIRKAYQYMFFLSVPLSISFFFLSKEMILILSGKGFESAVSTMKILTPIIMIIPFNAITNDQVFVALGKEKLIVISTSIGAIMNFIGNLVLIPYFAENGAAIATVLAEGTVAMISYCNVKKVLKGTVLWKGYSQYWAASIPLVIVGILTEKIHMAMGMHISVFCFISIISYISILFFKRNICAREISDNIYNKLIH